MTGREKLIALAVLCLAVTGCTVTDAETGKTIVSMGGAEPAPEPRFDSLPATLYATGVHGHLLRVRVEADKVTCYRMNTGISCLRDPEVP